MKTIPIDEQMRQSGERAGQKAYNAFVQQGIDQWHKEHGNAVSMVDTSTWQRRDIEASAEMPHRVVDAAD